MCFHTVNFNESFQHLQGDIYLPSTVSITRKWEFEFLPSPQNKRGRQHCEEKKKRKSAGPLTFFSPRMTYSLLWCTWTYCIVQRKREVLKRLSCFTSCIATVVFSMISTNVSQCRKNKTYTPQTNKRNRPHYVVASISLLLNYKVSAQLQMM
mgnify:CR=1 FL=1